MKYNKLKKLAPIILFTYNRLDHLKKTVKSLKQNKLSKFSQLIIYSDGPKDKIDELKIQALRKYLKKISGFKSVNIEEQLNNKGLAQNIIDGLNYTFSKYSSAIILEDDLVLSKNFLEYMNDALELYKNKRRIISIHAYSYPIKFNKNDPDYFFLRGADCWGWAAWSRSWRLFNKNGSFLKKKLIEKKLVKQFNFNNSYNYMKMLEDQIKGKNNSWAIRWYASAFLKNKLTLYPKNPLIKNIGIDGSGTHGYESYNRFNISKFQNKSYRKIKTLKLKIEENTKIKKKFENYFLLYKSNKFINKLLNKLNVLFK
jgi:GR25 family glycosyltransferase involved in LPS biosynthesis